MKKNELTKEELMAIAGGQDEMNLAVLAEDAPYGEIIRRLNGRENLEDLLNGTDRRVLDLLIKRRQNQSRQKKRSENTDSRNDRNIRTGRNEIIRRYHPAREQHPRERK